MTQKTVIIIVPKSEVMSFDWIRLELDHCCFGQDYGACLLELIDKRLESLWNEKWQHIRDEIDLLRLVRQDIYNKYINV